MIPIGQSLSLFLLVNPYNDSYWSIPIMIPIGQSLSLFLLVSPYNDSYWSVPIMIPIGQFYNDSYWSTSSPLSPKPIKYFPYFSQFLLVNLNLILTPVSTIQLRYSALFLLVSFYLWSYWSTLTLFQPLYQQYNSDTPLSSYWSTLTLFQPLYQQYNSDTPLSSYWSTLTLF
jgi:hypothetical protein